MGLILLVEDNLEMALLVQRTLETSDLVIVSSLHEATIALSQHVFDLILLEVNLPDGNGFDFFHSLRLNPQNASIAVIMLTSVSDVDSIVKGFESGVDDF